MQTVAVSVPADENTVNNTIALSQEVTCNRSADYPHDTDLKVPMVRWALGVCA